MMAFNLDYMGDNVSEINQFFPGHNWPCLDMNNNGYDSGRAKIASLDVSHRMHAGPQRRRKRTTFSKAQLGQLERAFSQNKYPDVKVKEILSSLTGLPESKIQVWFQNRRARYFKSKKTTSAPESSPDHDQSCDPHTPTAVCGRSLPNATPFPAAYGFLPSHLSPSLPESSRLSRLQDVEALLPHQPGRTFSHHIAEEWVGNLQSTGLVCSNDALPSDPAIPDWAVSDGFSLSFFEDNQHGSQPVGSRCGADLCPAQERTSARPVSASSSRHSYEDTLFADEQQTETREDVSEVPFQNIGEYNLSDLDISEAMIDYLLG